MESVNLLLSNERTPEAYEMRRSDVKPNPSDPTHQKVDTALYRAADVPQGTALGTPLWDSMALYVEFKKDSESDPFRDDQPSDTPQALNIHGQDTQGQLISYALQMFRYQHRTCLYSIVVMGYEARIIRWDRSGAIVTEKFNYVEEPAKLCRFFLAFARATPAEQGYDTTVTPVLKGTANWELMDVMAKQQLKWRDYAREFFETSITDPTIKRWKMTVVETKLDRKKKKKTTKKIEVLVGAAHVPCDSVVGRGTRIFVGLRCNSKPLDDPDICPFVALKDVWRVQVLEKEGDIMRELNQAGVKSIPTVAVHSDVVVKSKAQITQTDAHYKKMYQKAHGKDVPLLENPFRTHVHYRMVEEEVCQRLSSFKRGYELLKLIRDYLRGTYAIMATRTQL